MLQKSFYQALYKKEGRQEIFCQELIKGTTQRQAYYIAYPKSKELTEQAVDTRACRLASSDKVLHRLKELRYEVSLRTEITRDTLIGELKKLGFADIDLKALRPETKIKALEVIAKIMGYDKPENNIELEDLSLVERDVFD